jgi:hypothetical protein
MKSIGGIAEADCPRCGKHFVVQPLLVYKRGDKRFCSYHCYDHYLTEIESQKKKRGRKAVRNETY